MGCQTLCEVTCKLNSFVGIIQVGGEAWSERPELLDIFRQNYSNEQQERLLEQRRPSCSPCTPGSTTAPTVSSVGSPRSPREDQGQTLSFEENVEDMIKVKKSDCSLRLFYAMQKRRETLGESTRIKSFAKAIQESFPYD